MEAFIAARARSFALGFSKTKPLAPTFSHNEHGKLCLFSQSYTNAFYSYFAECRFRGTSVVDFWAVS